MGNHVKLYKFAFLLIELEPQLIIILSY